MNAVWKSHHLWFGLWRGNIYLVMFQMLWGMQGLWGCKGVRDASLQGHKGLRYVRAQRVKGCKGTKGARAQAWEGARTVRAQEVQGVLGHKGARAQGLRVQGHKGARMKGCKGCESTKGERAQGVWGVQRHKYTRGVIGRRGANHWWNFHYVIFLAFCW